MVIKDAADAVKLAKQLLQMKVKRRSKDVWTQEKDDVIGLCRK